jgi:hypothetical protein
MKRKHTGKVWNNGIYYYLVIEGECTMTKDGVEVLGPTNGMKKHGESFGETDFLFGQTTSSYTVIASNPASTSKTGKIVLCRLKDKLYDYHVNKDVKKELRRHMSEIKNVMDVLSGIHPKIRNGTIIHPYVPSERWLLRQWEGTVMQYVWMKAVMMMTVSAIFSIAIYFIPGGDLSELIGGDESKSIILDEQLDYIKGWWEKLIPLASFVSTFFLSEAYKHWRDFFWTCRSIQGKFNNISLAMAVAASREQENHKDTKLTAGARKALEDISHIQRLTHLLFWCSTVKRFNCILSPEGLSYLRMKRLMTQNEYTSMIMICKMNLGAHNASLTWLASRISTALKSGDIIADEATMIATNQNMLELRSLMSRISLLYSARMVRDFVIVSAAVLCFFLQTLY